ncbi:MAG: DUF3445 domain-containing protein [Sediminimonas qiaohouensis]|uniref:DUF3445 domain-containing protein n=1 Tax=Sediminimonas qiaohouensis TaxID=552061 RepID=A0A7C9HK19_9RHOB|nr:DUF3445 domain-containing protein [Sediminimonas qiaohouensis]MTJ03468.1 DUF3445 domain-containing protein [Sediminimonas qiaohouensis]
MPIILQQDIPYDPAAAPRLPGIAPLDPKEWLLVDDAYGPQMAERTRILGEKPGEVLALDSLARPAADELLETVLEHLRARDDFEVSEKVVRRPDGVSVDIDYGDPMRSVGHLVQEDLCLMERRSGYAEHLLTGAVLCFPASWRLSEKFMRPMLAIHKPVDVYDASLARRVQRLLDGVRPGRPLWRFNALGYDDPSLHQPRSEGHSEPSGRARAEARYLRSERQCLVRLPRSNAVVFSIHTYVLDRREMRRGQAGL